MRSKLPLYFLAAYLLVLLTQFVAAMDGIMYFFGLHWIFAIFAALLLAIVPAIGPLAGVYGAVAAWGWSLWAALLLFFWPYLVYGILWLAGIRVPLTVWTMRKYTSTRPADIEVDYKVIHTDDD